MKSEQDTPEHNEELGDFTTTLRVIPISCLAMLIGVLCAFRRSRAASIDRPIHQPILFWPLEHSHGFAGWQPSGFLRCSRSHWRGAHHWLDGAVWFGTNSRSRHSGSHRSDFDQWQPRRAESRVSETALFGNFHRFRRTVWRGRSDHHDRRSIRLHDRAAFSFDERRTKNATGGGSGRRNVRNVCFTRRCSLLAVELLLFEWKPRSLIPVALASAVAAVAAALSSGIRSALSRAGTPAVHRTQSVCWVARWSGFWRVSCQRC